MQHSGRTKNGVNAKAIAKVMQLMLEFNIREFTLLSLFYKKKENIFIGMACCVVELNVVLCLQTKAKK